LSIKKLIAVFIASVAFHIGSATAVGTFISAPNRVDMVHDAARDTIYITEGSNILRYHVASATFLTPIVLGGQLSGIDLSPDRATLAVADRTSAPGELWVFLVRLSDLAVTKVSTPKESSYEDGTWAVAFGADGTLIATSRFAGSGWVPMRRLDPSNLTWAKLGTSYPSNTFRQDSMVSASGDGKVIAFAESNISDGAWGTYDMSTGHLVRRQGYTDGTSWFNYEIAANANGSQFAIPTYGGTFIYNSAYSKIASIGTYAGPQPVGAAYHPVEPLIYFPWSTTGEVREYNAISLAQTGSYDFEDTFQNNGNRAYVQGRTRLSRDGSILMTSVTGGVRFVRMYAPLSAAAVTGTTSAGSAVTLGLKGSIGNAGQITYGIASTPAGGTVTINGNYVTYIPTAGFSGTDTFRYAAKYGSAIAESTVTVTVVQPNRAPVALNDVAETSRNTTVVIPVLANDSDPDGDALTITMAANPTKGSVAIQSGKVSFTPARNFTGTTSFNYSIADGKGGSASAQVAVTVKKR
jgi:hypothetical protein